jgi:quercetin dioxygenase-like cupin family protein
VQDLSDAVSLISAAMSQVGQRVDWNTLPLEGGNDPAFGSVRWRTIIDATRTPGTTQLVVGIAEFGPNGTLPSHRHAPPEVYLGLEGDAVVTIGDAKHDLSAGVALFVPGNAVHSTIAGPKGARFYYIFPIDQFSEVKYEFAPFDSASTIAPSRAE